jgi:small subunit ribosomal protein S5
LAGIRDILAKSLGTTNPINMLKATVNGLQRLRRPDEVAETRGLRISQVLPVGAKLAEEAPPEVEAQPQESDGDGEAADNPDA